MQTTTPTDQATLLVKLHEKAAEERPLSNEVFTIGRKPDNDLAIDDSAVSGHHARITKIHAVYFIEDCRSTNGTYVNDKRVDRHQLRDTDVITIGRHRLIFRDRSAAPATPASSAEDLDHTMVLTGRATPAETAASPASLRVLSGKTDRQDYLLVKQINVIGSSAEAVVRLTGWFAPASAALVTRRRQAYFVTRGRNGKKLLVNGQDVAGERELKDKDRIEVAGATLLFRTTPDTKA